MNKLKISVFLTLTVMVFSLGIFSFVYAEPTATNPIGFTNPLKYNTVEEVTQNVLDSLQKILGVLAVLFVVIGGLMYILSAGDEKKIETAKKIITGALIGLAIVLAAPAFLREIGNALGWPINPHAEATSLKTIAEKILEFLLSISGIIAIIFLVVGGLTYTTAYGDEKRVETGKKIVLYSVIGIVIILAALVIVKQLAEFF
jgi:type IV secretory pathway VirB2 component (pilin)